MSRKRVKKLRGNSEEEGEMLPQDSRISQVIYWRHNQTVKMTWTYFEVLIRAGDDKEKAVEEVKGNSEEEGEVLPQDSSEGEGDVQEDGKVQVMMQQDEMTTQYWDVKVATTKLVRKNFSSDLLKRVPPDTRSGSLF